MTPSLLTAEQKNALANKVFDALDDTLTADRLDILLSVITSEITTISVDLKTRKFNGERFMVMTVAVYRDLSKGLERIFRRLSDPTEIEILFQDFAEAYTKKHGEAPK